MTTNERKDDHVLGLIASEITLSDGTILNVKPATMGQKAHVVELLGVVAGFLSRLGGTKEVDENKDLRRELQARLGHAEADIMNAEPESAALSEAVAKKEMLISQIEALDAAAELTFTQGFGRLVSSDAVPFLMENSEKIVGPIRALSGYEGTPEDFDNLPIADAALMLISVLVVNVDFFGQRLKPIGDALASLKSALALKKLVKEKMKTTGTSPSTGDS